MSLQWFAFLTSSQNDLPRELVHVLVRAQLCMNARMIETPSESQASVFLAARSISSLVCEKSYGDPVSGHSGGTTK